MAKRILIGNTAQLNNSGTWDWTFYIRPAECVEEAVVTLHPSFRNPVHKLQGSKMELSCTGWGTFELGVDIFWRGGKQMQTKWLLRFDQDQFDSHEEIEVPAEVISSDNLLHGPSQPADLLSTSHGDIIMHSENDRLSRLSVLGAAPAIDPGDDELGQSWHGRLVQRDLPRPEMTWESQRKPREDKHGKTGAPNWLNASEYKDDAQTLEYKVSLLAHLLRCSKKTLAYTGAGLSVTAGIEMAAAGSAKARKSSPLEADPTVAHCIMAGLNRLNLLHGWVQQNHDGLPQKAGYRQEDINEIHGSWYDPSNPVVLYSGSLRGDLFKDMTTWAKTADLVLVLGTSLSGLNADQCVTKTARRSLPGKAIKDASLGSVIISPQRTPEDGETALRLFATADEVMAALAKQFDLQVPWDPQQRRAHFSSELRVKVPYDKNGDRSDTVCTWWDLSPGAKLRVSQHNNIEGAQQPAYWGITHELTGEVVHPRCS
jgi:NAD-dependent SIR2 family protein deacetylase